MDIKQAQEQIEQTVWKHISLATEVQRVLDEVKVSVPTRCLEHPTCVIVLVAEQESCPEWYKKLVGERINLLRSSYHGGVLMLSLQPQYVKDLVLADETC